MASLTPSAIYFQSLGSMTLTIADCNTASQGDIWTSNIGNIVMVTSQLVGTAEAKPTPTCVSWTALNGVINFQNNALGHRVMLMVYSGFGNKML